MKKQKIEKIEKIEKKKTSKLRKFSVMLMVAISALASQASGALNFSFFTDSVASFIAGKATYIEAIEFTMEIMMYFVFFGAIFGFITLIIRKFSQISIPKV